MYQRSIYPIDCRIKTIVKIHEAHTAINNIFDLKKRIKVRNGKDQPKQIRQKVKTMTKSKTSNTSSKEL